MRAAFARRAICALAGLYVLLAFAVLAPAGNIEPRPDATPWAAAYPGEHKALRAQNGPAVVATTRDHDRRDGSPKHIVLAPGYANSAALDLAPPALCGFVRPVDNHGNRPRVRDPPCRAT